MNWFCKPWLWLCLGICLLGITSSHSHSADPAGPREIWKGVIHFGDNPEAYSNITSAGMCMEVPYARDFSKKQTIHVRASDIQTLAGEGHFVEVFAHFEKNQGTENMLAATFRLKDQSGAEKDFVFEFNPSDKLQMEPSYYSIRIRIDNSIRFSLWDDFLVKGISLE